MIIRGNARFTLVFSALPQNCIAFDLFEDIVCGNNFTSSKNTEILLS